MNGVLQFLFPVNYLLRMWVPTVLSGDGPRKLPFCRALLVMPVCPTLTRHRSSTEFCYLK